MKLFESEHFDFKEWQQAFEMYSEMERQFPNQVQFVISSFWCTSGYWVEPLNTPLTPLDQYYAGASVYDLKTRIEKEIAKAQKEQRMPHLIF